LCVSAEFYSGNEIKSRCNEPKGSYLEAICFGYVSGVIDSNSNSYVCPAPSITVQQAADIVKKYINENPAQLHKPADFIVTLAIAKDFPCKKK
jgi:alanine-alpha-ketoisovalerate/valine-pyruvate aminotransferase